MIDDGCEHKRLDNIGYYEKNFDLLRKLHPKKTIIIVDKKVKYASDNFYDWSQKWHSLTKEEQLEAFDIYIPGRDEVIVI